MNFGRGHTLNRREAKRQWTQGVKVASHSYIVGDLGQYQVSLFCYAVAGTELLIL